MSEAAMSKQTNERQITTLGGKVLALGDVVQADAYRSDDMWLIIDKDGESHQVGEWDFYRIRRVLGEVDDFVLPNAEDEAKAKELLPVLALAFAADRARKRLCEFRKEWSDEPTGFTLAQFREVERLAMNLDVTLRLEAESFAAHGHGVPDSTCDEAA